MMRVHRIRITNVAGVSAREVSLAERGITLIAGQNESGKSTLFLALQALLDHPDDASHREVKALKPLHTGLTPEVEADLTIGPYRLTYSKSFAKGKAGGTTLRIDKPVPESLTGREAHDRVSEIIDQNLDRALWDAMRITQGSALELPMLAGVRSLSAALDRAVGNDIAGERESNLFERASQEFLRYWTAGGKPNKECTDLDQKAADAAQNEKTLREKLQELDADITSYKSKTREFSIANGQTGNLAAARDRAAADKLRLDGLLAEVRNNDLVVTAAQQGEQMALSAAARRSELIADLAASEEALAVATQHRQQAQTRPTELGAKVTTLEAEAVGARSSLEAANTALALAERDAAYQQNRMDLMLLSARLQAVTQADGEIAEAEDIVKSLLATKEDCAALAKASTAIAVAKAKLELASPKASVHALVPVRVRLNGIDHDLAQGQAASAPPGNSTKIVIGEVAEILIEGTQDVAQLERALDSANRAHQGLLDRLGVTTADEAESQRHRRENAADRLAATRKAVTGNLIDLTRESMRAKVEQLKEATSEYPATRPPTANALPDTLESAKAIAAEARKALEAARKALQAIEDQLRVVTAAAAAAHQEEAVAEATRVSRADRRDQVAKSLATARQEHSDDALQTELATAQSTVNAAIGKRDVAKAAYDGADPERVSAGLTAAEKALANHERNLQRIRDDINKLSARLEINGESGLEEEYQKAQRDAFVAQDAVARFKRRAHAAALLYETLRECREDAQRSYVAPLKSEIERLGKVIFGEEFRVVIGEDLSVEGRVMNGTTIPYTSLSSGAKEQIGILQRLATARIVGKGGVPLLLDDAVAYTDNVRQEALASALGFASADTQTIIVTCAPERYAYAPIEARIDF
jgi:energy-coupling factor transporter ATP-binding protein EcfA2